MTRARREYVCFHCEHPIPAGTEYHIERHEVLDVSNVGFLADMRVHEQRRDRIGMFSGDCDCALCSSEVPDER